MSKIEKALVAFNIILYCFLFIVSGVAYVEVKKASYAEIEANKAEQFSVKTCSLKDVVCKNTGNVLVDNLDGTPMEGAMIYIERASKYYGVPVELFLGIANAESSFRNFKNYNPWGIGNSGPIGFSSWSESVDRFAFLMKYYYLNEGKITAEQIMRKYVGWENNDWIEHVKVFYD